MKESNKSLLIFILGFMLGSLLTYLFKKSAVKKVRFNEKVKKYKY
jgi:uncharacterized membrane protein YciS (DUF1049 family)